MCVEQDLNFVVDHFTNFMDTFAQKKKKLVIFMIFVIQHMDFCDPFYELNGPKFFVIHSDVGYEFLWYW